MFRSLKDIDNKGSQKLFKNISCLEKCEVYKICIITKVKVPHKVGPSISPSHILPSLSIRSEHTSNYSDLSAVE